MVSQCVHAPQQPPSRFSSILCHLKTAPGNGLLYQPYLSLSMMRFSDADYLAVPLIDGWPSVYAEYHAMAHTTSKKFWVCFSSYGDRYICSNLGQWDNQDAIFIANNLAFHNRSWFSFHLRFRYKSKWLFLMFNLKTKYG